MPALETNFMLQEIELRIQKLSDLSDEEMRMVNFEWLLGRIYELRSLYHFFQQHQTIYGGDGYTHKNIDDLIIRPEIRLRFGI
ncbi:hypothetical protein ACP26L_36210 (plasmid) [Paenibacillus sp. S-38]|uniref:hypothetical protein n=1 Tax=Paenibacillus sp. S-38 TaxID=3416710 RepID=UPI003CF6FF7C